jgi:hypothetical protein
MMLGIMSYCISVDSCVCLCLKNEGTVSNQNGDEKKCQSDAPFRVAVFLKEGHASLVSRAEEEYHSIGRYFKYYCTNTVQSGKAVLSDAVVMFDV